MADRFLRSRNIGGLVRPDGSLGDPSLVVDLDGPVDPDALRAASEQRRVLVGFSTIPGAVGARRSEAVAGLLDTAFVPLSNAVPEWGFAVDNPSHAAYGLASAIRASPRSSIICAEILRVTETMPPEQALAVESYAHSMLLGGTEFRAWLEGRARPPFTAAREQLVRVERSAGVLHVCLDHPERRNSYSIMLRDQLVQALWVARLDPTVTRVELSAAGPSFCSGSDLSEYVPVEDTVREHLVRMTTGAAPMMLALADRLTVRMQGPTVGAGAELAAFAGRIVAAPDLTVRLPEVQMGLVPGAGGTVSLPRRIGRWRTAALLLSGTTVPAQTLLAWGLVDEIDDAE